MEPRNVKHLLVTVLLTIYITYCHADHTEFNVMPGGQKHSMNEKVGNVECTFTYVCQGGTNEKWAIEITQDGHTYVCKVHRPDGKSYLFFQEFELAVTGATLLDAEVHKNNGKASSKQFNIDKRANKVHQTSDFEAELTKVEVLLSTAKEDL